MKKFLLILLMIFNIGAMAQTVGYSHKALSKEGCDVKYSVIKHESNYYIIVTVSSDNLKLLKEPTLLMKNFDGEVIKLYGDLIGTDSETAGIIVSNMVLPVTEIKYTAQFEIEPEQFELIKDGVAKVRLSTIPIEHEKSFKKDKIGKKLYQFYQKAQSKSEDF